MNHSQMFIRSEVSFTRKVGKRSDLTISVGANMNVFNRLKTKEKLSELADTTTESTIDLGQRSREAVSLGLKLKFN